jgi:hypothetical protein
MHAPPAIPSTAIPGTRISNYRNSTRRAIRLIGLGAAACCDLFLTTSHADYDAEPIDNLAS